MVEGNAARGSGSDRERSSFMWKAWKPVGCELLMTGAARLDHLVEGRVDPRSVVALGRRT
jgi:hypothetical protein